MFHLCKQTRIYTGEPYCGYSSKNIPQEFISLYEAKEAQKELQKINPVGWNIYNAETGELVEGIDFFER